MSVSLIVLPIYLAILVGIPVLIGVYVYRDASIRGMNAALWTLVAVLAPALIGFIIYLLVRGGYSDLKCPGCNAAVTEQYIICPKCGAKLKQTCGACGFPVEADWTVCPKCSASLAHNASDFVPPIKKQDKTLGKILIVVIVIPFVLIISLVVLSFASFSSGGSAMNTAHVVVEQYKDDAKVSAWLRECDKNPDNLYALRFQEQRGEEKVTIYLIYRPSSAHAIDMSTNSDMSLFRKALRVDYTDSNTVQGEGFPLTSVSYYGKDYLNDLQISVNGEKISCRITDVDYNPSLFEMTSANE